VNSLSGSPKGLRCPIYSVVRGSVGDEVRMPKIIAPPWGSTLQEELRRWKNFQDVLRIDERLIFQDMMDECVRRTVAAAANGFLLSSKLMFLSVLFTHEKALRELCEKVERILNAFEKPVALVEDLESGDGEKVSGV